MSEDAATTPNPHAEAKQTQPFTELERTEYHEPKKDTTHGPHLVRVHSGQIVLTSPHPVASQVSAQGLIATQSQPTTRDMGGEPSTSVKPSTEEATVETSKSRAIGTQDSPCHAFHCAPHPPPKIPSGHMSGDSAYPSAEDLTDWATHKATNPPSIQSPPATLPAQAAMPTVPLIRVQQPTPDPSEAQLEEVASQHPPQAEAAGIIKVPVQHERTMPRRRTIAPESSVTVTEQPGRGAIFSEEPTAGLHVGSIKTHKSRLMLRRLRNQVAAEPLLSLALGRSVAKIAKPALRLAAHPTQAASTLGEVDSIARSKPPL